MSLPPSVVLVKICANSKCFIMIASDKDKVRVKGDVYNVSGASATFGPDKVFLKSKVEIQKPCDLTEELLIQLSKQEVPPPPKPVKPPKEKKPPKNKWANKVYSYDGARWELTDYARKQFEAGGYDYAMDQLGQPGMTEHEIADASMDMAAYDMDLTQAGVPEGMNITRECAADYMHEGMLKAVAEKKKSGEYKGA